MRRVLIKIFFIVFLIYIIVLGNFAGIINASTVSDDLNAKNRYKFVRNNREPRIQFKKTDPNYLYIYIHDDAGITLSKSYFLYKGKRVNLEFLENEGRGAYTESKNKMMYTTNYQGKRYDYGIKLKASELSTEYTPIFVFSFDHWETCFIKETFKIKKLENKNSNGEYYVAQCAPRVTMKFIDGYPQVRITDWSGVKSVKIVSEKTRETIYTYEIYNLKNVSAQGNDNDQKESNKTLPPKKGYTQKNGIYYPVIVTEKIDMNLMKKACYEEDLYQIRVVAEDSAGIKNEKTMITRVSTKEKSVVDNEIKQKNEKKKNQDKDKDKKDNNDVLNKDTGFLKKKHNGMKYYISIPENATENLPLIIFLHGDAETNSSKKVKKLPIVQYVKSKEAYKAGKFIFIAPVGKTNHWASGSDMKKLMSIIDKTVEDYKVDKDRIVLTGMSRGGNATWNLAWKYPDKFAGLVVVSGKTAGATSHAKKLANLPVYGICGDSGSEEKDRNKQMKKMIKKINGYSKTKVAKLETIHGASHGTIQKAYKRQKVFEWMLSQKRN